MEKIYKDSEERFVRNVMTFLCPVDNDETTFVLSFTPELTKESAVTTSQANKMFEAGQLVVYHIEDGAKVRLRPLAISEKNDGEGGSDIYMVGPGVLGGTSVLVLSDDKHEWDKVINPRPAG